MTGALGQTSQPKWPDHLIHLATRARTRGAELHELCDRAVSVLSEKLRPQSSGGARCGTHGHSLGITDLVGPSVREPLCACQDWKRRRCDGDQAARPRVVLTRHSGESVVVRLAFNFWAGGLAQ